MQRKQIKMEQDSKFAVEIEKSLWRLATKDLKTVASSVFTLYSVTILFDKVVEEYISSVTL